MSLPYSENAKREYNISMQRSQQNLPEVNSLHMRNKGFHTHDLGKDISFSNCTTVNFIVNHLNNNEINKNTGVSNPIPKTNSINEANYFEKKIMENNNTITKKTEKDQSFYLYPNSIYLT